MRYFFLIIIIFGYYVPSICDLLLVFFFFSIYFFQVWHRRTFQLSGLFAARVDLHGTMQVLILLSRRVRSRLIFFLNFALSHLALYRVCMLFSQEKMIPGKLGWVLIALVSLMLLV